MGAPLAIQYSIVLTTNAKPGSFYVVVEYLRYVIPVAGAEQFEAAYQQAGVVLDADPHCRRHEVAKGVEEPANFVVRIEWDSIEGHEVGFRAGPNFAAFFAAVRPFVSAIQEMKHYEIRSAGASK
jgi:quinol monooxygenase YgiN